MGKINCAFAWSKQFRKFPSTKEMITPKLLNGSYKAFNAPRTLKHFQTHHFWFRLVKWLKSIWFIFYYLSYEMSLTNVGMATESTPPTEPIQNRDANKK